MRSCFSKLNNNFKAGVLSFLMLPCVILVSLACGGGSQTTLHTGVKGSVFDKAGVGLVSANVYLIPVVFIDYQTSITQESILNKDSKDYDEPLEDTVRSHGPKFLSATTSADGTYHINYSIPTGSYYLYAAPSTNAHLPGGSRCRVAIDSKNLNGEYINIEMSGVAPDGADYIGSSACLICHPDHSGVVYTAHKQGISIPGATGNLQNRSNFRYFDEGTSSVNVFKNSATYDGGTVLTFGNYNANRGTDKFDIYEDATKIISANVSGKIYLWKNSNSGNYMMTLSSNTTNQSFSDNLIHLTVKMTYGGTLYKQNYLVNVPAMSTSEARKGTYPLLHFQGYNLEISHGLESNFDRTTSRWRDYNLGDWWNVAGNNFKAPPDSKTFEAQCATCHYTGYTLVSTTNEVLARPAVKDGDNKEEINIGCESCHGPGSAHQASGKGNYIVSLSKLSPERENMVCGLCHENATGIGSGNLAGMASPFDSNNKLPKPGISRADFLTKHTREHMGSASFASMWGDKIHSKDNHQQYTDFLKSKHYRNTRQLVVCSDCHDVHAKKGALEFVHNLKGDPANPVGELCMKCHAMEYTEHMQKHTAAQHMGLNTKCSDCHMAKTAKSGAGSAGIPTTAIYTALSANVNNSYLTGDLSSHVFDVVHKSSPGVAGVSPGLAMPAPYTNKCGFCHDVDRIEKRTAIYNKEGSK